MIRLNLVGHVDQFLTMEHAYAHIIWVSNENHLTSQEAAS